MRPIRRWRSTAVRVAAGLVALGPAAVAGRADAALLPAFTLSQATNLVSGQTIRVSWANQLIGQPAGVFAVFQCAGPFDRDDYYYNCDELALQAPAAASGSFDLAVHQQIIPDDLTLHSCNGLGREQCHVVLVASETLAVQGSLPILFGPGAK